MKLRLFDPAQSGELELVHPGNVAGQGSGNRIDGGSFTSGSSVSSEMMWIEPFSAWFSIGVWLFSVAAAAPAVDAEIAPVLIAAAASTTSVRALIPT